MSEYTHICKKILPVYEDLKYLIKIGEAYIIEKSHATSVFSRVFNKDGVYLKFMRDDLINEYFILLQEYRDIRIDEILNKNG